jgi:hypothetical protein
MTRIGRPTVFYLLLAWPDQDRQFRPQDQGQEAWFEWMLPNQLARDRVCLATGHMRKHTRMGNVN